MVVDGGGGGGYGLSGHSDSIGTTPGSMLIGLGPFREYIYFRFHLSIDKLSFFCCNWHAYSINDIKYIDL
jgi:hypothetical protein